MVTFDETGTSYTYDSEGNLISSHDNANRNGAYTYNDANELTGYTDQKNESYDYIYASGNKHQLIAARSKQLENGFTYTYDDRGNITATYMGKVSAAGVLSTADPYLQSNTTYNAKKNYVIAETDQRGNTINYSISDVNGLVNSITDAKGNVTNYTYNSSSFLPLTVTSGNASVSYTYDAWGKVIAVTNTAGDGQPNIAEINPIRYRGYYYDSETGLYYLNSRYYDPETGRFVNADDTDILYEQ